MHADERHPTASSRRRAAMGAALLTVLLGPALAQGATYAVRVRWSPSASSGVVGYRVATRALAGTSLPDVDAGLPAPAPDGSLATVVSGLDGRTDYEVTVTASASTGSSLPSNPIRVGYADVAARIDTDGDGLADGVEDANLNRAVDPGETSALSGDSDGDGVGDAADQCQGTAAGAPVNASGCPCEQGGCDETRTIWPSTAVPVRADRGPDLPVELGVKFRSDVAGSITGLRFYKHVLNTGTHVANLWSSTGTRLATATFSGESASGWQQVTFASPVEIAANTVYVASYHCPGGHYSFDVNGLAAGVDRAPLHALADGAAGGNGVHAYGATSRFPSDTYAATNYWVDVVFSGSASTPTLASIAVQPANPALPAGGTQQLTATGAYSDGSTRTLTGQVTWTTSNPAVATVSGAGLVAAVGAGTATITATLGAVSGATALTVFQQPATLQITTAALPGGTAGTAYTATLAASGGTPPYVWAIASGLPPGLSLNASTGVIAGTPSAPGTYGFTAQVTAGGQSATRTLSIRVDAPSSGYTIWPDTAAPQRVDDGPDRAVELGVKFRADVAGFVTGLRFYKHALNTGTHVANLWSSTGTRLATATFSGESAAGWQQVTFASPVEIAADTVYVASYHCPGGHYSADVNYFSSTGVDRPPLHALRSGVAGPNGVYAYGAPSRFPTETWGSANYWVDVMFSTAGLTQTAALAGAPREALAQRSAPPSPDCSDDRACADQDPCTTGERCEAGSCVRDPVADGSPCDDANACTSGDACLGGVCTGAVDAGVGDGRVRRFVLKRRPGGFATSATGHFAFPDGLDLATSGISVVFEDGAHRPVLTIDVPGSDLQRTNGGWKLRDGVAAFDRLEVRPARGRARVRLRGGLPGFELVDATGAPAGAAGGMLRWRVEFGAVCSGSLELACTDGPRGTRRCHDQERGP